MSPMNEKRYLIVFKESATPEAKTSCMSHAANLRGGHVKEIKNKLMSGFVASLSDADLVEFKSANFGDRGPIDFIEEDSAFSI
ncbi:hypothetical protein HWV62_2003 [Athelia sp. TMB]|nr:hypothetical protein HWV62_2003 [Athelia sp. TMB]